MTTDLKWKRAIININNNIGRAIKILDFAELQILMVVNNHNKFVGTITDGDVRRGLIKGNNLNDKLEKIVNFKPIVAPPGTDINSMKEIMAINSINQLPIIDKNKKIQGLHILKDFLKSSDIASPLVIMAGGKGLRLRPLTKNCPKPMLKIKGKPILEWIIINAKKQGFKNIFIITNYLSKIIEDYFKKNNFGVNIIIVKEKKYCGTFGGLHLLKKKIKNDFVLTNGDIVSDIKFDEILEFHKNSSADATMAVQPYFNEIPFGVVKTDGSDIKDIIEKPNQKNYVNAGVYVINSKLIEKLKNEYLNVTDFFKKLIKKKKKITAFALHEDWSDIGLKKNYEEFNQSE